MLKLMMGAAILTLFGACGPAVPPSTPQDAPTAVDSLQTVSNLANNLNVQANSITEIDSSGILMLPLSMGETERGGSSFYKSMPMGNYWNIVFYNSKTDAVHLLSEKKMLITSYQQQYNGSGNTEAGQTSKHIFYTIVTDDYNKDGKLTEGDPSYLFASDKAGDSLQQLSPTGCQLKHWQYLKTSNKLLMTVQKDSDKNNKFDDEDEIAVFALEMGKSAAPVEILPQAFKNKLKLLYSRQWQKQAK
jgi:hypothetical protein